MENVKCEKSTQFGGPNFLIVKYAIKNLGYQAVKKIIRG